MPGSHYFGKGIRMNLEEAKEFGAIYHHKFLVIQCLVPIIQDLVKRLEDHDQSKFSEQEFPFRVQAIGDLRKFAYGSPEWKEMYEKHYREGEIHYKKNRHHPEFFPEGIEGMTLVDLLEMLVDWKAANSRRPDSSMANSIQYATDKYKLTPQLVKILENTAKAYKLQ